MFLGVIFFTTQAFAASYTTPSGGYQESSNNGTFTVGIYSDQNCTNQITSASTGQTVYICVDTTWGNLTGDKKAEVKVSDYSGKNVNTTVNLSGNNPSWSGSYTIPNNNYGQLYFEVNIQDNDGDQAKAGMALDISNQQYYIKLYCDNTYTTECNTFGDNDTIYIEMVSGVNSTPDWGANGQSKNEVDDFWNNKYQWTNFQNHSQNGSTYRYEIPVSTLTNGLTMNQGEWYWLKPKLQDANKNKIYDKGEIMFLYQNGPTCSATAPTDLTATNVTDTQVDLQWSADCTNNDTYTVYRDGTALPSGTGLTCQAGTMTFSDTTVVNNTTYTYTVRGYNNAQGCESADSNQVQVTTLLDTSPPTEVNGTLSISPDDGTYTASNFTITEDFTDNQSPVSSCEYTLNGGSSWTAGTVSGAGPTYTCTASVTGATGALTIQMRATSSGGTSTPSATLNRTVDNIAPSDGTVTATSGNAQVSLSWSGFSDSESGLATTNTYTVVFDTAGTPADCNSGTVAYQGTATSYTHTGLTNGTTYYYRVCATDAMGNTSAGATASATPQSCFATAPSDLTGNAVSSTQVDLTWTADCANNAYYVVYRDGVQIGDTGTCVGSYTDTTAQANTTYTYTVRGFDSANNCESADSNQAQVTTPSASTCNYVAPTVSISPTAQTIHTDGESITYTVIIINNDSGYACTDVTFNLSVTDSDTTNFSASSLDVTQVTVAPGGKQTATLTVQAATGAADGATNDTYVVATEGSHPTAQSNTVSTVINLLNQIKHCSDCHGLPPKEGATRQSGPGTLGGGQVIGSHAIHVATHGMVCTDCHVDNGTEQDAYPKGLGHRDKVINMVTIRGGSYVTSDVDVDGSGNPLQDIEDGSGLGTCNNTACHGVQSPTWGTSTGKPTCYQCHGTQANGNNAPSSASDTPSGDTNKVGAHQAHLTAADGYTNPIACDNCHNVPSGIDVTGADGHLDGLPADVTFANSSLAGANGATPSYDSSTMTCSGVYCHGATLADGANTTPQWNDSAYLQGTSSDCAQCHGDPPASLPEHTGVTSSTPCNNCHSHTGSGPDHVNGTVTYPNATCTSCHGQPPNGNTEPNVDGSHTAHFNTSFTANITDCDNPACHVKPTTMNHANGVKDYDSTICSSCHDSSLITASAKTDANYTPNPTWGVDNVVCGSCHDNPPYNSTLYNHSGVTPGQCSGCHPHNGNDGSTQHMDGILEQTGGTTCSDCHGYPPPPHADGSTNSDPHSVHISNIKQSYEPNDGVWAWNPNDDISNWGPTNHEVCAVCHDMTNTNNHTDATDHIKPINWAFDNNSTPAYQTDFSCSNIRCHFGRSPSWK
jgi:predicted CxxxxCH...CXXCH cytochrome family protein